MASLADLATRWPRLSELLDEALDVTPAERVAWLEALEGEPAEMKDTLRRLLAMPAGPRTDDFLVAPPRLASAPQGSDGTTLHAGLRVGPYRLLSELGHGGMGAVWLAERADGQIERKVALKLPYFVWGGNLAERMARERNILATLEHPHIARLYDAGVDALGRPWMAMEYVQGQPIDVHARERGLDVPARLALLLQVCSAVAYAHSRLVIHRDLKPSNILVTEGGQVRLLDFGIAKLVQAEDTQGTALTKASGRVLTPDYASPEQVRGDSLSTASDVYSLGVVTYELLARARPYRLRRGSAAEVEEAVASAEPQRASSAATDPALSRQLRGDLDAILGKALKKERRERYATVDALADDLRRHIERRPVLARPDGWTYQATRFAQRWRIAVALGGLAMTAVLAGAAVALEQARQARLQSERARAEAATARAVQGFIENVFRTNSSDQTDPQRARDTTARQLLDLGAERVQRDLSAAPAARAHMLGVLASMYGDLGLYQRAADLAGQRVELARSAFGSRDPSTAVALTEHARALTNLEQIIEARRSLEEASAILDALRDERSELRFGVEVALASTARRYSAEAANAAARRSVAIARQGLPTASLVRAMHLEAQSAIDLGRFGQAIASLQEVIRLVESDPSLGRGQLVDMYGQLGEAQWLEGRSDEALDNLRQSYRVARNTPGTPALAIHTAAWQLASTLAVRASDFGEAIELLRPAYEWARAGKSDVPSVAANLVVTYARFLVSFGRVDDGLTALDEAPALLKGEAPHVNIEGPALLARAGALNHQGRYAQAEALADKARVLFASVADYEDWVLISTRVKRRIQAASGRADAAWADFQHEQSRLASQQIVRGPGALLIQIESAQLQLADGRVPAARSAAEQVLAEVERSPNRRHERLLEAEASLVVGRAALRQGDLGPASAALERAISIYRAIFDPACSLALADALGYVAHVQRALKQAALGAASAEEARRIHTCHRTVGAHHVAVLGADRG